MAAALAPTAAPMPPPLDVPLALPPLPFTLDLSCPIALPSRPARGFAAEWAFAVAGPSTADEGLGAFVRRRYLETVYLGEMLFPIAGLLDDLSRAAAAHNEALDPHVAALLLSLPQIEARHRRTLLPVIAAAMAAVETHNNIDIQAEAAGLGPEERDVLSSAVDIRMRCRAVAEGERGVPVKALGDEFERREVLVQLVLLLFYRGRNPPSKDSKDKEKRKKRRSSKPASVIDDQDTVLELLADRISVWLAVAELGIGADLVPNPNINPKDKDEDERSVATMVKRFWERALVPVFLPREHAYLAAFHLKVFGTPIPPELVPQKKPRKPKITRRLSIESSHSHSHAPAPKMQRLSSRTSGQASPPLEDLPERGIRRSASRASEHFDREKEVRDATRRSRSSSMDPSAREPVRKTVRAPSGKDLFKGREVGLVRRSSSLLSRSLTLKESKDERTASGLLGRKAAGENLRRHESLTLLESRREAEAETLILATPAKPKYGGGMFGPSRGSSSRSLSSHFAPFSHPTPIREEPSSAERSQRSPRSQRSHRSYVAETPVAPGRISRGGVATSVAETPVARRILETPIAQRTSTSTSLFAGYSDGEDYRDDDLGGLMVPTDDEDDGDDNDGPHGSSTRTLLDAFVPETPRK